MTLQAYPVWVPTRSCRHSARAEWVRCTGRGTRSCDRDVAVKVLPQSLSADPDTLARFEREAQAVVARSHPNILAIHDFGNEGGIAYAVTSTISAPIAGVRPLRSLTAGGSAASAQGELAAAAR